MIKSELRKIYLELRKSLSEHEIAGKSRQIADRFFESVDLSAVKYLHCFIPIAKFNEIDTSLIYKRIWTDLPSIRTVAPRMNSETGEMDNLGFREDTKFVQNEWGVCEPTTSGPVETAEIDIVLVPLLCFDSQGHRVGYGKGFYDRFLSECRQDCLKIGLNYFPPVEEITDLGPHDIYLNHCVTPEIIFDFETKKDG